MHAVNRIGRIVAACLSALLLLTIGYAWYSERTLDSGVHSLDLALGPEVLPTAPSSGTATAAPPDLQVDGKAENILIVGDDSRVGLTKAQEHTLSTGYDDGTLSTDTLLIAHVPADGRRATLISIPRDSYVAIPGGWNMNKINAAYHDAYYFSAAKTVQARQTAGADLLINTVELLTGVSINHYVQLGFAGFERVVQALGGITVNLCHAVDDTFAYNQAHQQSGGSGFVSAAGVHHLDPVRALQFVRQRHNLPGVGNDIGREARQRYFIAAAFDQILSAHVLLNPLELNRVLSALAGAVSKDRHFKFEDFARQMADLSSRGIVGQTIPHVGAGLVSGVGDVLFVNPPAVHTFVHDAFYPTPTPSRPSSSGSRTAPLTSSAGTVPVVKSGCVN